MKLTLLAPLAALAAGSALFAVASPAAADGHMEAAAPALAEVLAHERRDGDRARDEYRNPAETLAFFGVEPTMTVAEFSPGGGWYTRVLAPYLMPAGQYIAFNTDSDRGTYRSRAAEARAKGWTESFKSSVATAMEVEADKVMAFEIDEMPETAAGTVDRVLIFRSMHGLNIGNNADDVLKAARTMLKDDGMVGVVQHRAPDGASYDDYGARQRGYMRKADVIAIFEANGFELAGESEVNANPADPANWENGVWTLPPVLATGEDDARRSEYLAIGESDRMTLLFKKAD
ncbi:class I SAM-dependent methyltransferase [Qipengyuania sp. ASV99]|uniref:class I SAM-dependent methyltransferase n=1 Tax=Qipengyuania sp. ASV99 TaxID=3399681 RepID=UPI003A4C61D3